MNKHMPCIVKSKSRHVTAAFDDDHSRANLFSRHIVKQ